MDQLGQLAKMTSENLVLFGCGGLAVKVAEYIREPQTCHRLASIPVAVSGLVRERLGRLGNSIRVVYCASEAGASRHEFALTPTSALVIPTPMG